MWNTVWNVLLVIVSLYFFKKIFQIAPNKFKFYFYFISLYLSGSIVASVIWPLFLFNPKNVKNAKAGTGLFKHITKLYDLKWELRNGDILAEDRGAIIVSNHQSSLDVLGLFNIWNVVDKLTVIAKKELFYVWPFGLAAYLAGVVFIDRKDRQGAYRQLKETSEMMNKKIKIWFFPEGTRNKDCSKLMPFKKGAFSVAIAAQRPVIPVVFSPYYFINKKKYLFNKGHIVIQCLDPITTEGMTMDDVSTLTEKVHDIIENAYKNLAQEVLSALPSDYRPTLES